MFECYNNIIGLANEDCSCHQTGRPEDYAESASGLYLSELADIGALLNSPNCGQTLWDTLVAARATAVKITVADTNVLMGRQYKLKRDAIQQQVIGEIKARETYDPATNYAVVRIACNSIKGGYFTLRSVGTIFENVGAFDVLLYDNVDGYLETFAVTSLANKHKTNAINKKYPVYSKYAECLEYYLVYQFDEDNLPKNNNVSCGCGDNKISFNLKNNYFGSNYRNAQWAKWAMVGSSVINSLAELEDMPNFASNKMLGLTLEADFACDVNAVICESELDYLGSNYAMALALAVFYQTGVQVANQFFKTPTLDPKKLISSDVWEENLIEWQKKYTDYLQAVIAEIPLQNTDCYGCKDKVVIKRQGLFA